MHNPAPIRNIIWGITLEIIRSTIIHVTFIRGTVIQTTACHLSRPARITKMAMTLMRITQAGTQAGTTKADILAEIRIVIAMARIIQTGTLAGTTKVVLLEQIRMPIALARVTQTGT
jgi:hypothetical protein